MKVIIIFAILFIATTLAAPQFQQQQRRQQQVSYQQQPTVRVADNRPIIETISEYNEKNPDGSYRFGYVLSDGTEQNEEGHPRQVGDEIRVFSKGSYTYIDPEGNRHSRTYFTDEIGFHVMGDDVGPHNH